MPCLSVAAVPSKGWKIEKGLDALLELGPLPPVYSLPSCLQLTLPNLLTSNWREAILQLCFLWGSGHGFHVPNSS